MAVLKTQPAQFADVQVVDGISDEHKLAIIAFTKQDRLIQHNTSDSTRFSDLEAIERWLSSNRTAFTLENSHGELLGLVWLGPKVLETQLQAGFNKDDYDYTIAIRTYGKARGKGLAANFMRESLRRFLDGLGSNLANSDAKPSPKGIWAEISKDNVASQKTDASLGFKKATDPDEKNKLVMVVKVSDLLLS